MRRIYLARHGETEWNAVGRLQGATDIPLDEKGRAQARALGALLSGEGIVAVTTSDLSRARETGQIAGDLLGVKAPLVTDVELGERGFGVLEGLTREELETRYTQEWLDWREKGAPPPGAEQTDSIAPRMLRALARCFERGGPMLVVSHGAAMRLTLTELLGQPVLPIANGAVYRLDERENRTCEVTAFGVPTVES